MCLRELLRLNEMTYENVQLNVWRVGKLTPQETVIIIVIVLLVLRLIISAVGKLAVKLS